MRDLVFYLALIISFVTASTIPYGTDVSFPMHYAELPQREPDILGRDQRQQFYQEHLQGCSDYYDKVKPGMGKERCMNVEQDRIAMNLRQPQSMVNYTQNGFVKIRAPDEVWELIQEFWKENRHNSVDEDWPIGSIYVNHWATDVKMVSVENHTLVGGGNILKNAIWNAARTTLEEWTGQIMADCSLYGVRVYGEGSILAPHVDRLPLTSSAIINVDQDVDEPWPLEVIGHDGIAHNVTMEPGDLVLYESHSIIHGRPFPLKGRFMANIFIHFEPVAPLNEQNPVFTGDLPPYIIPGSPEVPNWQAQNPTGWQAVQTGALTKGTTEAHQIVIKQDLRDLEYILNLHPSYINQPDELGWTPLHEACRTLNLELVQFLVERGADIHAKTKEGQSVGFLCAYFTETTSLDEAYRNNPYIHPMVRYVLDKGARLEAPGWEGVANPEL